MPSERANHEWRKSGAATGSRAYHASASRRGGGDRRSVSHGARLVVDRASRRLAAGAGRRLVVLAFLGGGAVVSGACAGRDRHRSAYPVGVDERPEQPARELVRAPEILFDPADPQREQEVLGVDPLLVLRTGEPTLLDQPQGDLDASPLPDLAITDAAAIDLARDSDDARFTRVDDSAVPLLATAAQDFARASTGAANSAERTDVVGVVEAAPIPSPLDAEMPPSDAATLSLLVRGALSAWAMGIAGLVVAWLVGYARFVRRLPVGQAADDVWLEEWRALFSAAGVRCAIPLRVTADTGPMLCRLPRGFELLVPEPLSRELNERERACILRHELAHYLRGDVWSSLTAHVLALPHWFNPLAWWAVRRFDEAAEWACDRAAAADEPVTAYARTLLRLGEAVGRHASYSPAARGRTLAARIRRVLGRQSHDDSRLKKLLFTVAAVCIAAAALVRVDLIAREPESAAGANRKVQRRESRPRQRHCLPAPPASQSKSSRFAISNQPPRTRAIKRRRSMGCTSWGTHWLGLVRARRARRGATRSQPGRPAAADGPIAPGGRVGR